MSFITRRRAWIALGAAAVVLGATAAAIVAYLGSAAFDIRARRYIVEEIQRRTGARTTLGDFTWSFWQQRIRIEDLTLHGLEPAEQAPLAHFSRIDIGVNLRTLLERRIDLYELTITQPEFHVAVTPDGKTNFPTPETNAPQQPADFAISIGNFNVLHGTAILNERRIGMDLSLTNLAAIFKYHAQQQFLETHFRYDGVVDRMPDLRLAIPYTLYADIDYTRATLVAHRITVGAGRNEVKLQGRIDKVLSADISGKLAYTGSLEVPFLNYFFVSDKFAGGGTAAGSLEFSKGVFATQGRFTSAAIDYQGWRTTDVRAQYSYRYPDRKLTISDLKNQFAGGSVSGTAAVENLPGPSRVLLDLTYSGIDADALRRAYPWGDKYRIYASTTGAIRGWFEGRLERFDFSGDATLAAYAPPAAATPGVALPLTGSTGFEMTPGRVRIANADMRLRSTALKADGLIHDPGVDLRVDVASSDLRDIAFIYPEANGRGSFSGAISGAIAAPILDGSFTIENAAYQQWTIQNAGGGVRLDLPAQQAVLKKVRVRQGNSDLLIDGAAMLSGAAADLRVQSDRVMAADIQPFTNHKIAGTFAGDVRVTRFKPAIHFDGTLKAENFSVDDHLIGNANARVRFLDPQIDLDQLAVRQGAATLAGNISFNRASEAVDFAVRVNTVDLESLYPLGLPRRVSGILRQGNFAGRGTVRQPNVRGNATLEKVAIDGFVFPQVRTQMTSTGSDLDIKVDAGSNLNVDAHVNAGGASYPFTARVNFTRYALDGIASFPGASIVATGSANVSGLGTDPTRLRGEGRIESAEVHVQNVTLRPSAPFAFSFDPKALNLSGVTLSGESTQLTLAGTVGLQTPAPLNLAVSGQADLKLIQARFPGLVSNGAINLQVNIGGSSEAPDLRGNAVLSNASLRYPGFFTGLTNLNGRLSFNQRQIVIEKIDGSAGGGAVHAEGTAVVQGQSVQGLNVQIAAKDVRLRGYPEGLRTVVGADVNLRGSLASPLLEGNVQIQSLAYRSNFEDFLALLSRQKVARSPSELGKMRLSLHVEGGKNITIQNQLAEVEARVDIDWKGTVDEPAITGHIEASGGTLTFQGNRYTVTRGNIDFVDPLGIQPVIDLEAESQVRDYRVILSITGRGDNPKLSLRSEPPLPELEIVSLIAGGRTREEIAARSETSNPNLPSSEKLFQSGAASILFDLLQQRVGNRLGLLGAGRVRIDPFLVGAENNPGARITFSEQVTKDLAVTYSQDLSSNRQQVILLEYFVSRDTSILASRDELGNFGLDLRHRTRIK